MIFTSFNQLRAFYYTMLVGVIVFLCIAILQIIFQYNRANLIGKNIMLALFTLIGGISFIFLINIFNYGKYNIALIIVYLLEIVLINKVLKNLLDFFSSKVYYIYTKIFKWGKFLVARKLGSIED